MEGRQKLKCDDSVRLSFTISGHILQSAQGFVLRKGLPGTSNVKAPSLSESVPQWMTLLKNAVSEEEKDTAR